MGAADEDAQACMCLSSAATTGRLRLEGPEARDVASSESVRTLCPAGRALPSFVLAWLLWREREREIAFSLPFL